MKTTYQSDIQTISSAQEVVFYKLSDLNKLKSLLAVDARAQNLKDVEISADRFSFSVDGLGKVGFKLQELIPCSTIRLHSFDVPVNILATIRLQEQAVHETGLSLMLEAELPAMIKMMIGNKLEQGVNVLANLIANALNKVNT